MLRPLCLLVPAEAALITRGGGGGGGGWWWGGRGEGGKDPIVKAVIDLCFDSCQGPGQPSRLQRNAQWPFA